MQNAEILCVAFIGCFFFIQLLTVHAINFNVVKYIKFIEPWIWFADKSGIFFAKIGLNAWYHSRLLDPDPYHGQELWIRIKFPRG